MVKVHGAPGKGSLCPQEQLVKYDEHPGGRMYAESLLKDACSVSKRVMKLQRLKGLL